MAPSGSSTTSEDFELIDHHEASLTPGALAQVQAWLQPTDYTAESSELHRHLSSQAPGTGLWICDTSCFRQWHDSEDHGSLWIKGVPGAGKSVIAASMVEHLKGMENAPVLFFFFRFIVASNRRSRSLARDWLAQLLPHSIRLQASLHPLISSELDNVSGEQLWEYLLMGLSSVEKAYCIVDALDEMELVAGDTLLNRLNALATFRPGAVKLLMTSRSNQFLQSSLRDASIVHISLERDLVGKDIGVFVSHRLKSVLPESAQGLRDSLASTICEKSGGLFLYARLLLDQITPILQSQQSLEVKNLVNSLPVGLQEMYNSMLFQQSESLKIETCVQVFLLECVTHSSRPLRLNELASILVCASEPVEIPGNPKSIARSACAPLLEILEDETVQVIHHSFTEFLLDTQQINAHADGKKVQFPALEVDKAHKKLAMTCLKYLQSDGLKPNKQPAQDWSNCNSETPFQTRVYKCSDSGAVEDCRAADDHLFDFQTARLRYPFLEYSVENWAYHASHYDIKDEEFFRAVAEFINPENPDFRRWVYLKWNTKLRDVEPTLRDLAPSALHIAAYAGLTEYATTLLHQGQNVHRLDSEDRTPLHWACKRNHHKVVSLLLENGANTDPEDCRGAKPIHEAARRNYATIVEMLLEAGVDPLSPKTREDYKEERRIGLNGEPKTTGETAVQYVCRQGHAETLMVMLPFLQPETLGEILCESCRYGKFENVRVVLENSTVSPNSKFTGATALYLACWAHSVQCVELLLHKGADVHLISTCSPIFNRTGMRYSTKKGATPLHALVGVWVEDNHIACQAIFRMLIKAGADLEAKDIDNETALLSQSNEYSWFNRCPRQIMVRSLLEAGADISAVDQSGDTVLHQLLKWNEDLGYLQLLLGHGADVNARGMHGNTGLHSLFSRANNKNGPNSRDEVIKFLFEMGADSNVKNDSGLTVLELAVGDKDCSLQTFKLLLDSGFDEDTLRSCLFRVSLRYDYDEKVQIIQALTSAGVSLEARDKDGRTALIANYRSEDTIKALLQCGANLDAVDSHGRGLLHHFVVYSPCAHYQTVEKFQCLVDMGFDPLKVDKKGNNILYYAVKSRAGSSVDVKFITRILDYGVSVNAKNVEGRTPLHAYIEHWFYLSPGPKHPLISLLALFQQSSREKLDIGAQDAEGLTVLHIAAMRSEVAVSQLLAAGADASILTNNGRSVLHLACRARKSNIVGYLLQETGNMLINKADFFGRTPLHDACTSGRPESVYYLLKAGANIVANDSKGRTPLHACAEFVAEQHIWSMIERCDEAAGQFTHDRYRPLPYGSIRSQVKGPWYKFSSKNNHAHTLTEQETPRIGGIVKSLLAAGADIGATDSRELTPLDLALEYGCQDMISVLWAATEERQTSGQFQPQEIELQTLVALKQRAPISALPLSEAMLQEVLKHPLRHLFPLDYNDVDWLANYGDCLPGTENAFAGNSLLSVAANKGLTEIMECLASLANDSDNPEAARVRLDKLLKSQYDPKQVFTPILHSACQRELPNLEMLQLLVDTCGIDVNASGLEAMPGFDGAIYYQYFPTALHVLAETQNWWQLDAIKLLVEKGADVDARNEKGETPLHIASIGFDSRTSRNLGFWKADCVRILLELGADPNALDNAGMSPLNKAASASAPEIMRILVQGGADISAGKPPPLFFAIRSLDVEAVRIILDIGANPNSEDSTKSCTHGHRIWGNKRLPLFCASFSSRGSFTYNQHISSIRHIIRLLIEHGADVYVPLNVGETLIHYVFEHAEYGIIDAFLEFADKIDFSARDQLGRTVLLAACNWKRVTYYNGPDHLGPKVPGPVIKLLDLGADIAAVDKDGRHALHYLLDNREIELDTILQFLSRPACQTLFLQKDSKGFSPLHYALRTLCPAICEVLISLGADLMEPDPNGTTAPHYIASQVLKLHRHKSLPRYFSQEHVAEYFEGCLRLWQRYLDLGGDLNVRDAEGSPPLFAYLSSPQVGLPSLGREEEPMFCHIENFETFFGGDVVDKLARNKEGETALHIVASREKTFFAKDLHDRKLFEHLVARGLDPLVEDVAGRSALDVAVAREKEEILELFRYGK